MSDRHINYLVVTIQQSGKPHIRSLTGVNRYCASHVGTRAHPGLEHFRPRRTLHYVELKASLSFFMFNSTKLLMLNRVPGKFLSTSCSQYLSFALITGAVHRRIATRREGTWQNYLSSSNPSQNAAVCTCERERFSVGFKQKRLLADLWISFPSGFHFALQSAASRNPAFNEPALAWRHDLGPCRALRRLGLRHK
jgi:hypothetical protein